MKPSDWASQLYTDPIKLILFAVEQGSNACPAICLVSIENKKTALPLQFGIFDPDWTG